MILYTCIYCYTYIKYDIYTHICVYIVYCICCCCCLSIYFKHIINNYNSIMWI